MKVYVVAESDVESFIIKKIFSKRETAERFRKNLEAQELVGINDMLNRAKVEGNEFHIDTWQKHLDNTKNGEYIGSYFNVIEYEVDEN